METLGEYEIPVEIIMTDQKMEIVSSSDANVKLLISGAGPLIKSVKSEQMNVQLNLSQARVGDNTLNITHKNILLPPGIRLKKIEPSTLSVTLDTLIEKQLSIQPNWVGKLPEGLVMTDARPVPDTIRVYGGGLALEKVTTLFTEEIALNDVTASGTVTVALVLNPPSIRLEGGNEVQIQCRIKKRVVN